MNYLLFAGFIFSLFLHSSCQECPSIYLRYSKEHSFCKPKSTTCPIYHSGVTRDERRQIVDIHNKYRSRVATGGEKKAGGLPQAADMLQMAWDSELAAVAQRRAEQCIYEHDCTNCRRVANFPVGQNIAYRESKCMGTRKCPLNSEPNWPEVIKSFYDEVALFDKKYVKSIMFAPGLEYGHFTQIVWSKTWRIGCGFVAFSKEHGYRQFFVCNYGPGGNVVRTPMYKAGPICSSCPTNSCCGRSCKKASYAGLCRMNRYNEVPVYRPEQDYILYCDFRNAEGDCSASTVGPNKWKFVKALGGSFAEVVLKGGETSTLKLKKTIKPKQNFCLMIKYRTGPTIDGQKSSNEATVTCEIRGAGSKTMVLPKGVDSQQFFQYSLSLGWRYDTLISFTFSVSKGDPPQFFNIQLVTAKNGSCQ